MLYFKRYFRIIFLAVLLGCSSTPEPINTEEPTGKDSLRYTVFKLREGWGYDIYRNDTLLVHQTSLPEAADSIVIPSFEMADSLAVDAVKQLH